MGAEMGAEMAEGDVSVCRRGTRAQAACTPGSEWHPAHNGHTPGSGWHPAHNGYHTGRGVAHRPHVLAHRERGGTLAAHPGTPGEGVAPWPHTLVHRERGGTQYTRVHRERSGTQYTRYIGRGVAASTYPRYIGRGVAARVHTSLVHRERGGCQVLHPST